MNDSNFDTNIYHKLPQVVLGFHGCDKSVAETILNSAKEHLNESKNNYDWLGNGIYFWLNDPLRAYEWAFDRKKKGKIKEPSVIGAVIDLGLCLNLCERDSIMLLQKSYNDLYELTRSAGLDFNYEYRNKAPDESGFNLIRPLDCAVIEHLHDMLKKENVFFDTVYGYFQEGKDAFLGGGIKEKSHIQICVRSTDCIKGYFRPREKYE